MPEDIEQYLRDLKRVPWWAWLFMAFLFGLLLYVELEGTPDMREIYWLELIHGIG